MGKVLWSVVILCASAYSVKAAGFHDECISSETECANPLSCTIDELAKFCDRRKQLSCPPTGADRRCGCRIISNMYYLTERDACVVHADADGCISRVSDGSRYPAYCTPNADCSTNEVDTEGTCFCHEPAFLASGGLCLGGFGTACNVTTQCFQPTAGRGLQCVAKECSCGDLATWEADQKNCLSLIGGPCQSSVPQPGQEGCHKNIICETNNICARCEDDYKNDNSYCKAKHGIACTANEDCHSDFPVCDASAGCSCEQGKRYVGDTTDGKCLVLLGGECTANDQCYPNSVCALSADNSTTCQCMSGFEADEDDTCKGTLNSQCEFDAIGQPGNCFTPYNLVCSDSTNPPTCTCKDDNYIPLLPENSCKVAYGKPCGPDPNPPIPNPYPNARECHPDFPVCTGSPPDTVCDCIEGQRYDATKNKCLIPPGETCTISEGQEDLCEAFSTCSDVTGTCECGEFYLEVDGFCKAERPGLGCSTDDHCSISDYLHCNTVTSMCDCNTNYTQNGNFCRGFVDSPCKTQDNCEASECSQAEGKCVCPSAAEPISGRCQARYGASCPSIVYECNANYLLECNNVNCTCVQGTLYDPEHAIERCHRPAGGRCTGNGDCGRFATCTGPVGEATCNCNGGYTNRDGFCQSGGLQIGVSLAALVLSLFVSYFK